MAAPHVVIFPFMAQGHVLPLLDLSKVLACRGLNVTIITTPSNAPFIASKTSDVHPSTISLSIIPFPKVQELPKGCENVADLPSMDLFVPFIAATEKLKQPFRNILNEMSQNGTNPVCVISDFFLSFTLGVCQSFGIPRIVFNGMGVFSTAAVRTASLHAQYIRGLSDKESIQLSDLPLPFSLYKTDFPDWMQHEVDPNNPFIRIVANIEEADSNSWGVLVNSFEELEGDFVPPLESTFKVRRNPKAWCLGPFLLLDQQERNLRAQNEHIKWLEDQEIGLGSVIYVSFGSQCYLSDLQMDEIAFGLEMAAQPFIWVVRSKKWIPPEGWEERVKEKGLVIRGWVEQRKILSHPKIGGFLSHCGWNSVLEGLSMGIPLLSWPLGAEQSLNAKFLAEGLGAGIMVQKGESVTVPRDVVCDGVIEFMRGEKGEKARDKAKYYGKMARQAVEKGGSSHERLEQFIECLTSKQLP